MRRTLVFCAVLVLSLACAGAGTPSDPASPPEGDSTPSSHALELRPRTGPEITMAFEEPKRGDLWCASDTDGEVTCSPDTHIVLPGSGYHSLVLSGPPHKPLSLCGLDASNTIVCSPEPRGPTGEFVRLTKGNASVCGLDREGAVDCGEDRYVPKKVEPLVDFNVHDNRRACGLFSDGRLECWEDHMPSTKDDHPREAGFNEVAVGPWGSGCVGRKGKWTCWGSDDQPSDGALLTSVAVCQDQACGLDPEGRVVCWGDASTAPSDRFIALDCDGDYCGLKEDGTVVCWESYIPPDPTEDSE